MTPDRSTILIRTDASSDIGSGHFIRCTALAYMLREKFSIEFFCRYFSEYHQQVLKYGSFALTALKSEEDFLERLKEHDIVILDGYNFDKRYQQKIKSIGCKLVCIDDLHNQEFFADLIINHAPHVLETDYHAQDYTRYALGLEYALLRPAFLNANGFQSNLGEKSVFISFGGSDKDNRILTALEVITGFEYFDKIFVIIGLDFAQLNSIQAVNQDSRIRHYQSLNDVELLDLMLTSDLVIVPASGMLLEALSVCSKVISGVTAPNQEIFYNSFLEMKAIIGAGTFEADQLKSAIRASLGYKPKSVEHVDGQSGTRILDKILDLTYSEF